MSRVLAAFLIIAFTAIRAWAGPVPPPGPLPSSDCPGGSAVTGYPTYGAVVGAGGHCGSPVASGTINTSTVGQVGFYSGTGTVTGFTPGGDVSFSQPNFTVIGINGALLGTTTATAGNVLIGSGGGTPSWVSHAISGDFTMTSSGVATIANGAVTSGKMGSGAAASNIGALGGVLGGTLPNPTMAAGAAASNVGTLGGVLGGTLPNPTMASGAAASNVGSLGGVLGGTLPNPTMAAGAAAANVGSLSGVLGGTLPNPTMASGAAATNVGTLGGVLGGTLPNPSMAAGAAATNVGTLGGDLSGTLPSPTVAKLRTVPVCSGTPGDTQILTYSTADNCWEAKAAPTSGINQLTGAVVAGPGTGSQATTISATGVAAGSYTVASSGGTYYCQSISASGQVTNMASGACGGGGGSPLTGGGGSLTGGGVNLTGG